MSKYKLNKPHEAHSNGRGYITKHGHTMFNEDIVRDLERLVYLEKELEEARAKQFLPNVANWQPIKEVEGHPHGMYLVLFREDEENPIDHDVPYHIEEKYFTYKDGKTVLQNSGDGSCGVPIAFAIPRYYPSMQSDDRTLAEENRSLQEELMRLKPSKGGE